MTRGSCIPTDSVKSEDDGYSSEDDGYSSLVHNIETGAYIDLDRSIWHTWLVKVMKCRVVLSELKEV